MIIEIFSKTTGKPEPQEILGNGQNKLINVSFRP